MEVKYIGIIMKIKKNIAKQYEFLVALRQNQVTTPNDFTIGMGKLIKQAREKSGLSQAELATSLNRRQATISDIENGKSEIGILTLVQFALALNKPISYFFPKSILKDAVLDIKTPFQHEMIEIAERIEEFGGNQELVKNIINVLVAEYEKNFDREIGGFFEEDDYYDALVAEQEQDDEEEDDDDDDDEGNAQEQQPK